MGREHEVDSVFPELKEINGHELGSKTAKTLAALSECMCAELLALVSGKISESDSGTSKFDEIIAEDEDMTDCFDNCHLYLDNITQILSRKYNNFEHLIWLDRGSEISESHVNM